LTLIIVLFVVILKLTGSASMCTSIVSCEALLQPERVPVVLARDTDILRLLVDLGVLLGSARTASICTENDNL